VIAYCELSKLTAGIPVVLQQKAAQQVGHDAWNVFKVRITEVEDGGNIGAIHADLFASSAELVTQWLSSVQCDGVRIEAKDIFPLLGRDPFSMQLAVAVNCGHFADQLDIVATDQIFPLLNRLQRQAANLKESEEIETLHRLRYGHETPAEREERMVKEMRGQGIHLTDAVDVDWAQHRNDEASEAKQAGQRQWEADHGFGPNPEVSTPEKADRYGLYDEL
jgi:hypothetical protein